MLRPMTLRGSRRPTLAIVSGRPGSGKTTLARELAQAVSCPLISRDEINEGIFHTFDHDLKLASKDDVAKVAFDAFFKVIELLVASRVTLVAEAAFQDHRWRIGLEPLLAMADMRIIHCTIDPELAHQRIARRRFEQQGTPRAKRTTTRAPDIEMRRASDHPFEPLSLPVTSLHVATTDSYDPGLDEIVAFITVPMHRSTEAASAPAHPQPLPGIRG